MHQILAQIATLRRFIGLKKKNVTRGPPILYILLPAHLNGSRDRSAPSDVSHIASPNGYRLHLSLLLLACIFSLCCSASCD